MMIDRKMLPAQRALVLTLATVVAILFSAWTVAADQPAAVSGFLDPQVQARLQKEKLSDGRHVMRWISSSVNRKNYKAVMVDRAIYYPQPTPGPQISSSTLAAITDHLTYTLKSKLGEGVSVVDKAGPGVLRIQPAFTAVSVEKEGMSAADIIPIHLLFTAAKHASGSADYDTKAQLEVRITDSVSGAYMGAATMNMKGKTINKDAQLTLVDVQKSLDEVAGDGAQAISTALK
jgi:hypothetical protein